MMHRDLERAVETVRAKGGIQLVVLPLLDRTVQLSIVRMGDPRRGEQPQSIQIDHYSVHPSVARSVGTLFHLAADHAEKRKNPSC